MFFKSKKAKPEAAVVAEPAAGAAVIAPSAGGAEAAVAAPVVTAAVGGGEVGSSVSGSAASAHGKVLSTEELKRRLAQSRQHVAKFGEMVSVLLRANEWRARPVADLEATLIPPLMAGQFAVAEAQSKETGAVAAVALVVWARVSDAVNARIEANLQEPIRLAPTEWQSGENLWIVEAVGDARVLQGMLKRACENEWAGRFVKVRTRGADGKPVVTQIDGLPRAGAA